MLSRILSITAIAGGLSLASTSNARAQAMPMQHPKGSQRTITGTVVDVSCRFGQGLSGDSHRQCAQICADKGIPLAILGTDGKLYIPTSTAMPGDGQNGRLKEFAEQQVTVTGTVFPAGGANAIQIASIERKS
jgi:type 1 fimbria pilin